jgi:membrane protease YdiL (CAAX protease family)
MPKKETAIKHATAYAAYLLVVWGFYRLTFKLPEEVDELVLKPLIWLVPLCYLVIKERASLFSLGITTKNLFPSLYLVLILGVLFTLVGAVANYIKHSSVNFSANIGEGSLWIFLGLSFATAISEELAFRGYIFNRVWHAIGNELKANLLTSFMWMLVHLPVVIFWWRLDISSAMVYLVLTTIYSIGAGFVFARTKNISSTVLLHVLWQWPIILFR